MKKVWSYVLSSVVLFTLVLSACAAPKAPAPLSLPAQAPIPAASPAAPQSEWDKVLAAAKKEGTVTVYSTSANQLLEASREAMGKYGIKVETIGGSGGELVQRILTEQRAKANIADMLTSGWTNNVEIVEAGYGEPSNVALPALGDKDVWKVDPGKYDSTQSAFVFGMGLTPSLIINTDLVKPGEIQSWQDLLDPKWKDKIVMSDPRAGSGPAAGGIWVWAKLGEDYWKKLATQRPTMTVSAELPTQQVAYGEKYVAIFPNFLRVVSAITAGAPVQLVHLKEGTAYYISGVGRVKNSPHPNAALVLLNWMFTKEGQAAVGKSSGLFTVRKDVTEDWIRIRELRAGNYTLLEPAANFPGYSQKGAEFARGIFGAR